MDAREMGKREHTKRRYKQFNFRIRRESELYDAVTEFLAEGDTSLNFLITKALCAYLGVKIPHREYDTYTRQRIC
jgi:predicted HicB family RNase H-like nuclease